MYLFLFFKSFITFTSIHYLKWHICIKYYSFQSFYFILYIPGIHVYIFFFTNVFKTEKKSYSDPFWDSIQIFLGFFYLKEQINLQHQSYGNCCKSADTRPIIQSLHTTVESISCTSKLNACAPKYIIKIEQWKNCGVWWHKAI